LLPNVLWPFSGYVGLFATPDVGAVIVVASAAGLRLYPSVGLAAGGVHLAGLATLAVLDVTLWGAKGGHQAQNVSLFALLVAGAISLAVGTGAKTLALARAAAKRAVEAERSRLALTALLREHHDVRSFLSAATLNSEIVLRNFEAQRGPHELGQLLREVRD